jgi:cytochrome c-type biogenesis protein CcmH/NrfF
VLLSLVSPAFAQHEESGKPVAAAVYSPYERDLQREIVCMCGTCGRKNLAECTCAKAAEMRDELSGLVKQGKTREEVIQYYVAQYGSQEPLSSPIDKGFNRLAWFFPYAVGAGAVIACVLMLAKWSRRPLAQAATPAGTPADPELLARLDRELEDLD